MGTQVLTVSSKGQIAIPVEMRKMLSIGAGDKLVAYALGDTIMLKLLKVPTEEEFEASLKEAQAWAKSVNLTEEDINSAIKEYRAKKNEDRS